MTEMLKVLYFSVWYPSEKDEMAGLFVKKHKEAAESICRKKGKDIEIRVNTFWSQADIIQLNVISLKWGLLALAMHWLLGTPYIIIEHWSAYLPANGTFDRKSWWYKALARLIARHAEAIYPVSQMLENNMKRCGIVAKKWGRMNNVVEKFFYEEGKEGIESKEGKEVVKFLHVSCFDEQAKNIKGILRAAKHLTESRKDFTLTLVGTGADYQMVRDYAESLEFPMGVLRWTGELTPLEVCREMQKANAFVLFSHYENAPVVLSECMAAGLPIISSRVGFVDDLNPKCGIWVEPEDEQALYEAMLYMCDHHPNFDKELLRREGRAYSYPKVGEKLLEAYTHALSHN